MALVPIQHYRAVSYEYPMGSVVKTAQLDSADNDLVAFSFCLDYNPFGSGSITYQEARVYVSASTSGQLTGYIYDDNGSGAPNGVITNGTSTESGAITAGNWVTLTWPTPPTLTAGSLYWLVLKCTTGTTCTVQWQASFPLQSALGGGLGTASNVWRSSTFTNLAGGGWTTGSTNAVSIRHKVTNGTDWAYFGFPISTADAVNTSYKADGTTVVGFTYTTSAYEARRIKSVIVFIRKFLSPGNVTLYVYDGLNTTPNLITSSNTIPAGNVPTAGETLAFDLASVVALQPSTTYRFFLGAASGNASNYYATYTYTWDSDSNSTPLNARSNAIATFAAGSVTVVDNLVVPCGFILDSTQPYTQGTGGNIYLQGPGDSF